MGMTSRSLPLLLVPVLLTGCAAGDDVPPLTRSGGCGEVSMWAADDDGRTAVVVSTALEDRSASAPTTVAVTLPDPRVEVVLVEGEDLVGTFCSDVPSGQVDRETPVVEGEVVVRVDPPDTTSEGFAEGSFELGGATTQDGRDVPDTRGATEFVGFRAG